jgi:ferritin-like metal-binding protein YciE
MLLATYSIKYFMERMNDLKALLKHDIQMLYSAEQQIIEAMPVMISRVHDSKLEQSLQHHLNITERQLDRLDKIREMMGVDEDSVTDYVGAIPSLLSGGAKCKGMEGLIDEGEKIMAENLSPEVMDAAIVGCTQKIEHFEIASYGTARTYALQLGLTDVAKLLQQTLTEEVEADKALTALAMKDINQMAASDGMMGGL